MRTCTMRLRLRARRPPPSSHTSARCVQSEQYVPPTARSIPPTFDMTLLGRKRQRTSLAGGASFVQAALVSRVRELLTLRRTRRFQRCGEQNASASLPPFLTMSMAPQPIQVHPQASPDCTSAGAHIRPSLSPKAVCLESAMSTIAATIDVHSVRR